MTPPTLRVITNANDVSDHLLVLVANCVEDWFPPENDGGLPTEGFIDRLCDYYLNPEGVDMESYDSPASRKIMRHARRVRSEMA